MKAGKLMNDFIKETGLSFDGIPINGVHMEYVAWLEKKIVKQNALLADVSVPLRLTDKEIEDVFDNVESMHISAGRIKNTEVIKDIAFGCKQGAKWMRDKIFLAQ